MEMDVETTQIAAACLGIGTVMLCRRQKKRRERKIWVNLVVRRTCIKEAVCLCPTAYFKIFFF